jgi:hypothetical protein
MLAIVSCYATKKVVAAFALSIKFTNAVQKPDTLEDLQKMLEDIVSGVGSSRGGVGGRVPSDGTRRTRVSPYPQPRR